MESEPSVIEVVKHHAFFTVIALRVVVCDAPGQPGPARPLRIYVIRRGERVAGHGGGPGSQCGRAGPFGSSSPWGTARGGDETCRAAGPAMPLACGRASKGEAGPVW